MRYSDLVRSQIPAWTLLVPTTLAFLLAATGDFSGWIDAGERQQGAPRDFPWGPIVATLLAALSVAGCAYVFQNFRIVKKAAWRTARVISAADLAEAGSLLEFEAFKVADLFESSAYTHKNYANSLQSIHVKIAAIETSDQLRAIASRLAAENHRMQTETRKMAESLEASRSQIDKLHFSLQQAQEESRRDPLTEVGNRRAFEAALTRAVEKAVIGHSQLSIVMLDIDNFKHVNDTYGHTGGDAVLKAVAQLIETSSRENDTVARMGGEEFALLLPATENLAASILAERLRARIEAEQFKFGEEHQIQITASLGVAQRRDGEAGADLIQRADSRLYRAKNLGRNRVVTT